MTTMNIEPNLYLQFDGDLPDNKLEIIEALISDITTDFYFDDLCGPTFYIDTKNLNSPSINQIIKIGASFDFHVADI